MGIEGNRVITTRGLTMTYRAPVRDEGLGRALRSLVHREYRLVQAVRELNLEVGAGEVVGFIGPLGAGKTTTLKMLSGILHPSSGEASVLGMLPWRREPRFLRQIAMVRGSQPIGEPVELTVLDWFRFQQLVYEVPAADFRRNVAELSEMLELGPVLRRQVRALSLGERMRAGLALALVYRPRLLFMDEPTLGLDVSAIQTVRRFIAGYAAQTGATVLLTSHYMADVEQLCRRIVLIDAGTIRYDGDRDGLSRRISPFKLVTFSSSRPADDWTAYGEPVHAAEGKVSLRVDRELVAATTARLLRDFPVSDLSVEDPPLESVIDRVYRGAAV